MYKTANLYKTTLSAVVALFISCLCCRAGNRERPQIPKDFTFGSIHSLKGVGLCSDLWYDSESFTSLSLTADLIDILNGESSVPGCKLTYHYNFILRTFKHGGTVIYAGPGVTAGHVRNIDNRFGFMSGVSGAAGVRHQFDIPVVLSLEFQADFALIFKNRYNPNMSLYRAGFKQSYYPHLRIQYVF